MWRRAGVNEHSTGEPTTRWRWLFALCATIGVLSTACLAGQTAIEKVQHPAPMSNPPPVNKGHPLPRLRGINTWPIQAEDDIRRIGRDWGANLIRFQVVRGWHEANGNRDLEEYARWMDQQLDTLEAALEHCETYGMYVLVDLHAPPGGRYENRHMAMFYEKQYAEAYIRTWEKIARRLKGQRFIWAYDLINEPHHDLKLPEGMDNFRELQIKAAKAIRAIDPHKPIMMTVFKKGEPEGFEYMTPVDLPNVIYQAHMYKPMGFTYQFSHTDKGTKPVEPSRIYPGRVRGKQENIKTLREYLKPVRDFQLAYNVPIYIGEFSAPRWAPGAEVWLNDVISICEEYDWDWSYNAYRASSIWNLELTENKHKEEKATEPTLRLKVLKKWWAKNKRARGGTAAIRIMGLGQALAYSPHGLRPSENCPPSLEGPVPPGPRP